MKQTGQAALAPERIVAAYRLDTRALVAARVGPALGLFVLLGGTACALEWMYFPARRAALPPICSLELITCLATIVLVHLKPSATWWATVLYIVKRLTEALGGQIAVDSQVGSGTRFTLSLPTQPPQHVRQEAP